MPHRGGIASGGKHRYAVSSDEAGIMTSGLPFDDFRALAGRPPPPDASAADQVRADLAPEALGRITDIAAWFAAATGHVPARVAKPVVALFAGTHAVSRRLGGGDIGTLQARIEAIAAGAAPISSLCASGNLGLNVFDLALEIPVEDITQAPALDERAAAATMAFGMEVLTTGADLLCLGTVDGSGDVSALALLSALGSGKQEGWEDAGEAGRAIIAEALSVHANHLRNPLEAMRRLGGREIAAIAGAILAARTQKVAVILDGLSATAAAAVLHALEPAALSHCLLAGVTSPSHRRAAARIGLEPVLDFGIPGIGAALAAELVKAAGEISAGAAEARLRQTSGLSART